MGNKNGYLRKQVIVDKSFQFRYLLTWIGMTMALLGGLVLASVSMVFLLKVRDFNYLVIGNAACAVVITILAMRYMIRLSHRIAGPAFRLEKVIREVADGTYEGYVSLRKKDYLKHVAESVNYLIERTAERGTEVQELHRLALELAQALENEPNSAPEVKKLAHWQVEKLETMLGTTPMPIEAMNHETCESEEIHPVEVGM